MATPANEPVREALSRTHSRPRGHARKEYDAARRVEALSLRMAGLTFADIGERLKVHPESARQMVKRALAKAEADNVDELREVENRRLDRAQAAIWPDVLRGDRSAIDTFLRISGARRQMNGLNAPSKVEMSVSIKQEMDQALKELEAMVLEGEVVESVRPPEIGARLTETETDSDDADYGEDEDEDYGA